MAFTGDLEHLPIVDVIQLLHSTKKSGILCIKSRKGESQLVFKDGYIVSANHLNNSVRIGQILIDLKIITPENLEQALKGQSLAGANRRPLIITLVEMGLVKEDDAYKGLEHLIEMTVVEILTWKKGHFILEVLPTSVADEYRYYPGKLNLEINVDTQSILMDSLRIFDEKVRDGEIVEEDDDGEGDDEALISADDLGLADLDDLGHSAPKVFKGLTESDPCKVHRLKLLELAPMLNAEQREELALYFGRAAAGAPNGTGKDKSAVFLSTDRLFSYCLTTACTEAGITTVAGTDEQDMEQLVARLIAGTSAPVVIFDSPASASAVPPEKMGALRQQLHKNCPGITMIQLAGAEEASFALQAYRDGVKAVLPRPTLDQRRESCTDLIGFLDTLPVYLHEIAGATVTPPPLPVTEGLRDTVLQLKNLREVPDIALALLQFVATQFERAITFIVRDTEVIAERGIGINGDRGAGVTPALGYRIPLEGSLLLRAAADRSVYLGAADEHLGKHLYQRIKEPSTPRILLLALKNRGKTIAFIYGDFGAGVGTTVELPPLEILACQAELMLENALYRKKLEKPAG